MTMPTTEPTSIRPIRPALLVLAIVAVVTAVGVLMAARPALIDALWPSMSAQRGSASYQAVVQFGGLLLAGAAVAVATLLSRGRLRTYWGLGRPAAPAGRVAWLGVREGTSWRRLGLTMLAWISALLAAFLYLGLAKDISRPLSPALLVVAVAFAGTNAVAEEAIFRLSIVGALRGVVNDRTIMVLGASIFGAIHYVGVPGGPIGVLMAGFLGWFLTKSILETGGVFWAVLIHLVQDVIIFAFILHL